MSKIISTIRGSDIIEQDDGSVTFFAGATLDGDGANGQFGKEPCYAPRSFPGCTLDVIGNAGRPGNYFGVVTDTGKVMGNPVIQGSDDPAPGAFISATSLHLTRSDGMPLPDSSPFKYVDSATVPFIVVPPVIVRSVAGIVMGCRAVVTNTQNGRMTEAVVADTGPASHLGEMSVACAEAIGLPVGAVHRANGGGVDAPEIHYRIHPGVAAVVNGTTYPLQPSGR